MLISSPITDVESPRVDTQRRCQVTFARLVLAWTMTAARVDNSRQRHQASETTGQIRAAITTRDHRSESESAVFLAWVDLGRTLVTGHNGRPPVTVTVRCSPFLCGPDVAQPAVSSHS